jgi:hypothetical protein
MGDIKYYVADAIEKLNKQRLLITSALSLQPKGLDYRQRMDWPIVFDSKKMSIMAYLNKLAVTIPDMKDADSGRKIDHVARLMQQYSDKGADGVDNYLKDCVVILGNTLNQLIAYERADTKVGE